MFGSWLASPTNILFRAGILSSSSTVLELGCGVSAVVGLALAPLVSRYVLSDQPYVARFVEQNLEQNRRALAPSSGRQQQQQSAGRRGKGAKAGASSSSLSSGTGENIAFHPLDWEADTPTAELTGRGAAARSFDLVLGCDCVYNDALVQPFAQTCADACALRSVDDGSGEPCVCLVAQQLRSPDVFEAWLRETCAKGFRVWRVPDAELPEGLRSDMGFVVHVGVLR